MTDWMLSQGTVDFRREEREWAVGRHGAPIGVDETGILSDDPALALAGGDMDAWLAAHPCDCDGLCMCDQEDE